MRVCVCVCVCVCVSGDVVQLLAKWVGRERVVWARVWKKYAKIYPGVFQLSDKGVASAVEEPEHSGPAPEQQVLHGPLGGIDNVVCDCNQWSV